MRYKLFGILNLLVIIFYLIQPLLPFAEYLINRDYIEKNLCVERENPDNDCHGKCYLHEQISKQTESKEEDSKDNNVIPEKRLDDHLRSFTIIQVPFENIKLLYNCFTIPKVSTFSPDFFVPPKG